MYLNSCHLLGFKSTLKAVQYIRSILYCAIFLRPHPFLHGQFLSRQGNYAKVLVVFESHTRHFHVFMQIQITAYLYNLKTVFFAKVVWKSVTPSGTFCLQFVLGVYCIFELKKEGSTMLRVI